MKFSLMSGEPYAIVHFHALYKQNVQVLVPIEGFAVQAQGPVSVTGQVPYKKESISIQGSDSNCSK